MSDYVVGDLVLFGSYEWRILDVKADCILMMTEEIIEQRCYHDKPGDVTWDECTLRYYLNHEFYETFTEEERARIIPVTNNNKSNEWYGTSGGTDTVDHLFLLSTEEVACLYFGDSGGLLYNPGKSQRYWLQRRDDNNIQRRAKYDGYSWWWWLRSPGRANWKAVYIHGDGNIGIQGNGASRTSSKETHPSSGDNRGGVRPAVWIKN